MVVQCEVFRMVFCLIAEYFALIACCFSQVLFAMHFLNPKCFVDARLSKQNIPKIGDETHAQCPNERFIPYGVHVFFFGLFFFFSTES